MRIQITPDEQSFYDRAAWVMARQIMEHPRSVMGFATGRTTGGIHAALARIQQEAGFDASQLVVFAMDEITGVPRTFPGACYDMILRQVVEPLGIPESQFIMPQSCPSDPKAECEAFVARVFSLGGIDLLELGIGENGHIGFNQPGTPFSARAVVGEMDEALSARIHRESGIPMETHLGGITLGIRDIMQARHILLCANGSHKAEIVQRALRGEITPQVPSSVLQLHPNLDVILDADAGRGVRA